LQANEQWRIELHGATYTLDRTHIPVFPARTPQGILGGYLSYPYRRISHPINIHDSRCSVGERALLHSSASGRSVIVPDFFVLFPPMLCPACIGFPEEAASATFVKSFQRSLGVRHEILVAQAHRSLRAKLSTNPLRCQVQDYPTHYRCQV
jgi:hypothetical protein